MVLHSLRFCFIHFNYGGFVYGGFCEFAETEAESGVCNSKEEYQPVYQEDSAICTA